MRELEIIERLRRIATAPEALGLLDDVAVLDPFVVTHDTIAEGVHFLPQDPPASVGWKLVAVNLSDIAAKGASPVGALLSLTISGPGQWELDFLAGVEAACESYGLPLIGVLTLTATINDNDTASNNPPVTVADTATVKTCGSITRNVVANDTDPDGDYPLIATIGAVPSPSTVLLSVHR